MSKRMLDPLEDLPPDMADRMAALCQRKDPRFWEQTEDPRKTPEDYRKGILFLVQKMGIDPKDHSRALGHILYETQDPRVLAAIYNQLNEVVRGDPNPVFDLPAHEGFEKLTWSVAALALPHSSATRSLAYRAAFGLQESQQLEKGQAPCGGAHISTLEGLSEEYQRSRGGISSPTVSAVFAEVAPDLRPRMADIIQEMKAGEISIKKLTDEPDPVLASSLIDFNRALLDSYMKRKYAGQERCDQRMANTSDLCMSQFAVASGGMAQNFSSENPENNVTHTPRSTLIRMVKFENVDPKTLALTTAAMMMASPEGDTAVPLTQEPAQANGQERFSYPAKPSPVP